jgi:hypothetical protein
MPKLKPGTISPTPEEARAITAAANADPDAVPYTDQEWEHAKSTMRLGADFSPPPVRGRTTGQGSDTRVREKKRKS